MKIIVEHENGKKMEFRFPDDEHAACLVKAIGEQLETCGYRVHEIIRKKATEAPPETTSGPSSPLLN